MMQLFKSWMPEYLWGIPIRRIASEAVQQPVHFAWFFLAVAPLAFVIKTDVTSTVNRNASYWSVCHAYG